jgi:hypothetical protein
MHGQWRSQLLALDSKHDPNTGALVHLPAVSECLISMIVTTKPFAFRSQRGYLFM